MCVCRLIDSGVRRPPSLGSQVCPDTNPVPQSWVRRRTGAQDPLPHQLLLHASKGPEKSNRTCTASTPPLNFADHCVRHSFCTPAQSRQRSMAGAVVSPFVGVPQHVHEHSRGRQSLANAKSSLSFPTQRGKLRPALVLRTCRQDSRSATATAYWRAPACSCSASSRLSVSCGAGIAQPGEVIFLFYHSSGCSLCCPGVEALILALLSC